MKIDDVICQNNSCYVNLNLICYIGGEKRKSAALFGFMRAPERRPGRGSSVSKGSWEGSEDQTESDLCPPEKYSQKPAK